MARCFLVTTSFPRKQIIRRLLQFGIPGLEHPQLEPFFIGLLQRMTSVLGALERHQSATQLAGVARPVVGEGEGGVLEELQELAERMAGTAVDAQRDHPIGFRRYVRRRVSGRGWAQRTYVFFFFCSGLVLCFYA